MRVYGRVYDELGVPTWQMVETQADGSNDYVFATALIQCIKLDINESPFYADWGIPGHRSVVTQIFPDYYVALMQQRFADKFANLQISRVQDGVNPIYRVEITRTNGSTFQVDIPQ